MNLKNTFKTLFAGLFLIAASQSSFSQGDDCATASVITPGTYGGSTVGMGADVAPACITTDGTGGGVWYSITGANGCMAFTADLCTGTTYDSKIRVYEGTCGALVCVTGNDDFCVTQSQVSWDYTPGVTYYILVHGYAANEGTYSMTITETVAAADITPPSVIPGPGIVDVNITTNNTCMADFGQADLAQSFIPAQNTICGAGIELTSTGTGVGDVTIQLWDGLPNAGGMMLATGMGVGSPSTWVDVTWPSVSVIPGVTYYLVCTGTNTGLCWAGDVNNGYANGNVFANAGYGSLAGYDYVFRTTYGCGVTTLADLTDPCSIASAVAPTAVDACVGVVTGTPDLTFPITVSSVITWTYDDGNGNTSTQTQNVIITDITAPVPNGSGGTIDVDVTTNNTCMADFGQADLAQSFIPAQNTICGAGIELTSTGTGVGDVTIQLWDGLPNAGGMMLATGMGVGSPSTWVDVTWPSVSVIPGVTYYLVCTGTNTGLCWAGDVNNGYANGNVFANAGYGSLAGYDYVFRTTYGCGGVSDVIAECSVASVLAPTAIDACAGTVTGTPDVTFPITTQGTTIVTWTFIDAVGNTSTVAQNVIITDTIVPIADLVSLADETGCGSLTLTSPTATDNCLGAITGTPDVTFPITTQGTTLVTWTYDDGNGNVITQTQNAIVNTVDVGVTLLGATLTATAAGAVYQWVDCEANYAPFVGETNESFTPAVAVGTYAVIVTENGCTDTSACFIVDYSGLSELTGLEVSIYPNPSNGIFNVEFNGLNEGALEMNIVDIKGRLVLSEIFSAIDGSHIQEVNISESENGIYIVKVIGESGMIFSKRIVKQQ